VKLRAWIVVAACAVGLVPGVAAAAAPTLPTSDPFYTYTGSTPLASIAPGTVLKSRTIAVSGSPTMPTATELLYRTTGELGQPTVTVTTVIRPLLATSTKIISYQMAYDALGPKCDPSYTLQGGNMSGATTNFAEQQLISAYVAAGDTAVIPDYEGTSLDWAAGQESGDNTLDAIRAAESFLKASPASTPVAMVGYSGGSIATDFAAELASTYAPQLHIVGIGEGGIPVDMAHNLTYINGSKGWSGVIPAVLVAIARAFQLDLTPFSSAYGLQIAGQVKDECINSFFGAYPGLTVEKLLNSTWQDFFSIPHVAAITDKLVMGTNGTPTAPMFMGVGNADGTGDGVMIAADDEALAHEYCQKGVPVQFNVYKGDDHTAAAIPFEVGALAFLTERLNGLSVSDGCSSIGAGNALTPVTLPPGVKLRYGGPSTRLHGVVLFVRTKGSGALPEVTVTVKRGRRVVKSFTLAELGTVARKLVVRSHGHTLARGRYRVTVTQPTLTLATRSFRIR
jgi:hypothetical protein